MTIIIGKEGDQPFKINSSGVSRRHACITVSDDGQSWMLEDLGSANGTFVRNPENGLLRRAEKIEITPMTFICLGPDNAHGCSFYARQVLPENYDKYDQEYAYLRDVTQIYDEKLEKVDRNIRIIKYIGLIVNIGMLGASFFLPSQNSIWLFRGGTLVTSLLTMMYDGAAYKKRVEKERERFSHCPNPNCNYKLRPADIINYQCPKCKKPN